jgi:hypothetical protein
MQHYQSKIDYAIGAGGMSAPAWIEYANMIQTGFGTLAAVVGALLVVGRFILFVRDWNKGRDDA